jgi:hypothetical protein
MCLLWLAPRVSFFLTLETHVVISFVCLCLILSTPLALSPQKLGHSYSDNNTRSLSLSLSPQKVTRSIYVLRCPRRPVSFAAASCARSEDCATAKGARADVDHAVLHASDPPPRLRSPSRKSSSRWKLIGPFYWNSSAVFLCDELCSFSVRNADGVCCSGLDAQTAPRRLGEFLKRGQWFSKSSRGGYEKLWCSGNALPLSVLS